MIKYILLATIIILAVCKTPHEIFYLENENNKQQINVYLNQEIIISLDANPTTGYTWTVSKIDATIIKQLKEVKFKPNSEKLGSPGKQIFHFQAISVAKTELKLIYHRPWEKEVVPLDTFQIQIDVLKN